MFSITWLVIGFLFLFGRKLVTGVPVLHPEDYKSNMQSSLATSVGSEAAVEPEPPAIGGISLASSGE
jgi:hypothetical protein